MKILLCADLHLGSGMLSLLPARDAAKRKNELLITFKRITELAKNEGAGAVIIAGDLFDTDRVSSKETDYVTDRIKECPEIDFYLVAGNHDSDVTLDLEKGGCENLHIFKNGWTEFEKDNVSFIGRSDICPEMYDELSTRPDRFSVVVLHGQEVFSISHGGDNIVIPLLEHKGIDLLALGHLHSFHSYPLAPKGVACYPGCPEGRGFDECGEKGVIIIDTEGGFSESSLRFVKTARRTLHDIEVRFDKEDISLVDCESKVLSALEGVPCEDLVKVTLTGELSPEAQKDISYLEELLRDRFFYGRVKDCTRLYVDLESYAGDISLKGEFIRLLYSLEEESDFVRDLAECGIKALRGESVE